MQTRANLPDTNRLSVIAATILLAYAATPLVDIPESVVSFPVIGIVFDFSIDFTLIVSVLVAILAAVGSNWLLYGDEPVNLRDRAQHWILPALSAWVIGLPLRNLELGLQWWAVFVLGGILLIFVLVSEYVVLDPSNPYYAFAYVSLTAFSYAMYLFLAIAIHAAGLRLYLLLPALLFPLAVLILRAMYLRFEGRWFWEWAGVICVITAQIAIGLHYLPLTPVKFGLVLLGPVVSMVSVAGDIEEKQPIQTVWVEPVILLVVIGIIAYFI